jgi:hypothetical protein
MSDLAILPTKVFRINSPTNGNAVGNILTSLSMTRFPDSLGSMSKATKLVVPESLPHGQPLCICDAARRRGLAIFGLGDSNGMLRRDREASTATAMHSIRLSKKVKKSRSIDVQLYDGGNTESNETMNRLPYPLELNPRGEGESSREKHEQGQGLGKGVDIQVEHTGTTQKWTPCWTASTSASLPTRRGVLTCFLMHACWHALFQPGWPSLISQVRHASDPLSSTLHFQCRTGG